MTVNNQGTAGQGIVEQSLPVHAVAGRELHYAVVARDNGIISRTAEVVGHQVQRHDYGSSPVIRIEEP